MSLVEAVKIEEAIGKLVAKVEGARTELTAMRPIDLPRE